MQRQTPPAGFVVNISPRLSEVLLYHKSPGWTESWLIKLRASEGQHKTAVCVCLNQSTRADESCKACFSSLIWVLNWDKNAAKCVLEPIKTRQSLDIEFAHWQISYIMVQTGFERKNMGPFKRVGRETGRSNLLATSRSSWLVNTGRRRTRDWNKVQKVAFINKPTVLGEF